MLSISQLTGDAGGIANYVEGRSQSAHDYYTRQGASGHWHGAGASAMGLHQYARADLIRLLEQAGSRGRPGYDLCYSAPKSISALWAIADDGRRKQIEDAQRRAVDAALKYLERSVPLARRGKGGLEREHAGLLACSYQHGTSRADDPDLHSHAVVLNLAQRQDGSWGGIEGGELYKHKMMSGAVYRAELADGLRQIGMQIEQDGESFRVAGVPDALCAEWSKRRRQIVQAMEQTHAQGGKAAERLALASRPEKQHHDQASLIERWRAEAKAHGLSRDMERSIYSGAHDHAPHPIDRAAILARLTESKSTFGHADLIRAAAVAAQTAGGGLRAAEALADDLLTSKEIVRLVKGRWTTTEMLEMEKRMITSAQGRQTDTGHVLPSSAVDEALKKFQAARGFGLSGEQAAAVRHIVEGPGSVRLVQGGAGTGKSTMLEAARVAWEAAGKTVIGTALSGKASKGLTESSGIDSINLARLLWREGRGQVKLTRDHVIVLDEAGMVGTRQMSALLDAAAKAEAKIVMVGDARQLQAISAGGAFRALQDRLGAAELHEIRRQHSAGDREIVQALADGRAAEALDRMHGQGRIHVGPTPEGVREMVIKHWVSALDPERRGESIILAGTRADVSKLNALARAAMIETGLVADGLEVDGYAVGDRIIFMAGSRAAENGVLGEVRGIRYPPEGATLDVRTDDGRWITVDEEARQKITHGYAVSVHKAQGATMDHAYILIDEAMTDAEWAYVAGSRHRETCEIFCDSETWQDLDRLMGRSRQKDIAMDYLPETEQEQEDEMEMTL